MKLVITLCFIITLIFSCSSKTTTTTGTIDRWCTQTPHYQTCHHFVTKRNTSTAAITINQFLDLTVHADTDEARVVLKRAKGIEANYPKDPEKSLWHSCVDYFDDVVFELNEILDHTPDVSSPEDINNSISASLTDVDMCEDEFAAANITMSPVITTNLTELVLNSAAITVAIIGGNPPPSF
ncbi:putative pectinesterase/pectinesterase inhibitor 17 [Bidens hawaiensis]|uniref:putative pectinesterase/pectinesterase inhibitor 17 n=1 Tax=Bidens hawaiensis TaxID=980011 RepID=UPI00404B95DA